MSLTAAGLVHTALATLCIVVGFVQLIRPKGGSVHRMRGYAFVGAMLVADVSALAIRQFTGDFNMLHAGAIVNLVCIAAATLPLFRRPRPPRWLVAHYRWMAGAYLGLIAAGVTEFVVRLGPLATKTQLWTATAVATAIVTLVGCLLIARYHPRSLPRAGDITGRP